MPSRRINAELFRQRLSVLYKQWKSKSKDAGTPWAGLHGLVIDVGDTQEEDALCSTTTAFQIWLLQAEFSDSLMVFLDSCVFLLVSKRYQNTMENLLQELKDSALTGNSQTQNNGSYIPEIIVLYKDKEDNNQKNFEKILSSDSLKLFTPAIQPCVEIETKMFVNLGFSRQFKSKPDKNATEFIKTWKSALESVQNSYIPVNLSVELMTLMAVKDEAELQLMKESNTITNNLFKDFLREEIMGIVDGDLKVKHSTLADKLEKCFRDAKYIPKHDLKYVDPCYPPIIQSGGKYSMKINHTSTEDLIRFDVITCSFGTVYKNYCSNVTRTFLINPTPEIMNNYRFLQTVQAEIIKLLVPGGRFCEIYESILNFIKTRNPGLSENLHPNLGFCTGILFSKQPFVISPKSTVVVAKGMVIHVCAMLCNLVNKSVPLDKPARNYALMLGDTVVVNQIGPATILEELSQKLSWIKLVIEPEVTKPEKTGLLIETEKELLHGRSVRKAVLASRFRKEDGSNEKRFQQQKRMIAALNINSAKRFMVYTPIKNENDAFNASNREIISYKKQSKFPTVPEIDALKIYVDRKYETLILPVFGLPIPFHVATLKNVSTSVEGHYIYLRINFLNPSTTLILEKKTTPIVFQNPFLHFVKQMTFRSSTIIPPGMKMAPSENLLETVRLVKEMRKKYKLRISAHHEAQNICEQGELICFDPARKKIPMLKNVIARPTVSVGDKYRRWNSTTQFGALEAHQNGCRFRIKNENIDILYSNILCAIFQPCDKELGAYIHFVLRDEMLISKKKVANVQFYTEGGEGVTDLGKNYNCVDRHEEGLEIVEREQKRVLNTRYRDFCKIVQSISDIDFEEPLRELGFMAAPGHGRTSVLLQPTTSALINVTEWPPFVIMLDDIELIHFERVEFVLRTFDMVVIYKDYNRKVTVLNAVPICRIEKIKSWMEVCEIPYTEGPASLNWTKIMKTIREDPAAFFETGGWTFLEEGDDDSPAHGGNNGDTDTEETRDADGEYEPPSDSSSTEEEEQDEESDCSQESTDSDPLAWGGTDSEQSDMEGKSWDELEREARAADNRASRLAATSEQIGLGLGKRRKHLVKCRPMLEAKKARFSRPGMPTNRR